MTETLDEKIKEGKYITFMLNKEEYGIRITSIHQIIGMTQITPVPHTPDFIKGVFNLRGKIIPMIDLRLKFGLEFREYDERTCIIVVEISGNGKSYPIGVAVDAVSEVLNITSGNYEETPSFGVSIETDFILGMAKVKEKIKIILDINKVLTQSDIKTLKEMDISSN